MLDIDINSIVHLFHDADPDNGYPNVTHRLAVCVGQWAWVKGPRVELTEPAVYTDAQGMHMFVVPAGKLAGVRGTIILRIVTMSADRAYVRCGRYTTLGYDRRDISGIVRASTAALDSVKRGEMW